MPTPPNRAPIARLALDRLEDRTALNVSLPDISLGFVTTKDSHSVTVRYDLTGTLDSFQVGVYRSADASLDAGDDLLRTVTVRDSTRDDAGRPATRRGQHTLTVRDLNLPQDPGRPYVFAVADPAGLLAEGNEANNADSFRKHLLGVVTHGFSLEPGVPGWAKALAAGLESRGYDDAFAFDWAALSKRPAPGLSALAAGRLAAQITARAAALNPGPGDVVDLHTIGHSRGAVVNAIATDRVADRPLLRGGWVRETMLDPHPARNLLPLAPAVADLVSGGNNVSEGAFYAYRPGPLGVAPMLAVLGAQQAMNDPVPYFATGVDQAEVFYQNTPGVREPFDPLDMDTFANSWGYRPDMIPNLSAATVMSRNLDGLFHFQVPIWYLANLNTVLGGP